MEADRITLMKKGREKGWMKFTVFSFGLIGMGMLIGRWLGRHSQKSEGEKGKMRDIEKDPAQSLKVGGGNWDVVDEASWESFPASDPPAY